MVFLRQREAVAKIIAMERGLIKAQSSTKLVSSSYNSMVPVALQINMYNQYSYVGSLNASCSD